jgi:U3 small nucleolar RNA-associated protein 10
VLLAALSQNCKLTPEALKTIVEYMGAAAHLVEAKQFINAAVAVCALQEELHRLKLPKSGSVYLTLYPY